MLRSHGKAQNYSQDVLVYECYQQYRNKQKINQINKRKGSECAEKVAFCAINGSSRKPICDRKRYQVELGNSEKYAPIEQVNAGGQNKIV